MDCSTKRMMLQLFFDSIKGRRPALEARAEEGYRLMEPITLEYNLPPDPDGCCERAVSAAVAAADWLALFRASCVPAELSIQNHINQMCYFILWTAQVPLIEAKLQNYINYLDQSDQEIGSMETLWHQIRQQCPVPKITYP